jgi:DNA-binding IclR family transcriptional regulator
MNIIFAGKNMSSDNTTVERASGGPSYHVPALEKGLDILECLAAQGVPMTQAQLARALGRGSSELFRMLAGLERRGYIARDPVSGAYSLTLRLYELSRTHSPFEGLLRAATRPMRELTARVRESVHLSVVYRGQLLVLVQEESPAQLRLSIEVGGVFSLLHTASGRTLLAHLGAAALEDTLSHDREYASWSAAQRAALAAQLVQIGECGYTTAVNETHRGVSDVAVLVGSPHSRVQAALAIAALNRDPASIAAELLPPLRACAGTIARAAGIIAGPDVVAG